MIRLELSILSFLSALLLAGLIIITLCVKLERRSNLNVANISIIGWLLVCNLIHAINAIIWAGNNDLKVHALVWCDIGKSINIFIF